MHGTHEPKTDIYNNKITLMLHIVENQKSHLYAANFAHKKA